MRWGKVEITGGFLLVLAFLYYMDNRLLLAGVAACILHELGHLAAISACGGAVTKLRLSAVGAEMVLDRKQMLSYGRELFCTLAGPCVNLTLALIGGWLGASVWAGLNLVLGCFQLLPVLPLDGGRAFYLLLCILIGEESAMTISAMLGRILSVGLVAAGTAQAVHTRGNFTLLLVGIWIFSAFGKQKGLSTSV